MGIKIAGKVLHFILILIFILIQLAFFEQLEIYFIDFDIILLSLLIFTIWDGSFYGILYGFLAGLIIDVMTGGIIGLNAFIYSIDVYIIARLLEVGFKMKLLSYIFIVFLVTEMNMIIFITIRYLFSLGLSLSDAGLRMLTEPFYNIILVLIFYPVLKFIRKRKAEFEF